MSNTLAIAAVTATLRNMLNTFMPKRDELNGLTLTTMPPDLARKAHNDLQLNVFLYHTAVNTGWRNRDMPGVVRAGESAAPALALNLQYLITAYGKGDNTDSDDYIHRVLGAAMSVLHDHAVLDRADIALALAGNDLAGQFESLRITWQPMSLDEMSKLWTIFQAPYRLSAAYEVTVVLIDSHVPVKSALPVLARGADDRGPNAVAATAPVLDSIVLPRSQPAARLGESISLLGKQLSVADAKVRFTSPRLPQPIELDPQARAGGALDIALPAADPLALWAPGFYTVGLVLRPSALPAIVSNEISFALAPQIVVVSTVVGTDPNTGTLTRTLNLTCFPRVVAGQRVLLLLGDRQIAPQTAIPPPPTDITLPSELAFEVQDIPGGDYVVRLRVDGVDSIPVTFTGAVPAFDPAQKVTLP
jgi:hypothetical protein